MEITERKNPQYPPVYEKLQIYDLGKRNDWNIYLDADALIRPDLPDVTTFVPKDTVLFHGADFASTRWRFDKYFLRDGRHIGACNWFAVGSDWCLDLWHPFDDITYEEAVENIFPTPTELNKTIVREHLIDDYLLSRNIARYGLKHKAIIKHMGELGYNSQDFLWHDYVIGIDEKLQWMLKVKQKWGIK